jgi:hypothetical protein
VQPTSVTHSCHVDDYLTHDIHRRIEHGFRRRIDRQLMVRNKPGPNLSDLRRRCPLAIHGRESTSEGTACCSRSQSQNARAFSKQQSMHVFSPTARAVETTDRSSSSETGTYRYRPDPRHRRCWRPRCRNKDRVGACLVRRLLEVADGASHASC